MDYRLRLKLLRVQNKLEQTDIAEICSVSPKTVSGWENERQHISIDCIRKLCIYYKVSADEILEIPKFD